MSLFILGMFFLAASSLASLAFPHLLGELIDACCAFIKDENVSDEELLEIMPGPDFPTGGLIMGQEGCIKAYKTGRGSVIMRGRTEIDVRYTGIILDDFESELNTKTPERRAEIKKWIVHIFKLSSIFIKNYLISNPE